MLFTVNPNIHIQTFYSISCCRIGRTPLNIYSRITDSAMTKPIYILNGPNLNLLGQREPEIYGHQTLGDIEKECRAAAKSAGYGVEFRQSNIEGEIVDHIQEAGAKGSGLIINPAAYTISPNPRSARAIAGDLSCPKPLREQFRDLAQILII